MLEDGVKSKLDSKKWKDHLFALGVHSPLFDVDGVLNGFQSLVDKVRNQPLVEGDACYELAKSVHALGRSFAGAVADLAREETAPDSSAYSKSACKRRRQQARKMRSRARETWTEGDLAAAASAAGTVDKSAAGAVHHHFVKTLVDRASMYLAQAAAGTRLESTASGLSIVTASGTGMDPRRAHLATYYAAGFAAHAALCEAHAPGYNGTLVVLDDIPPEALGAAQTIFSAFVNRNRDHVVMMACADKAAVHNDVTVVVADSVNARGLATFVI
jgi:hypothetical protein